jgi:hypothetical protein
MTYRNNAKPLFSDCELHRVLNENRLKMMSSIEAIDNKEDLGDGVDLPRYSGHEKGYFELRLIR